MNFVLDERDSGLSEGLPPLACSATLNRIFGGSFDGGALLPTAMPGCRVVVRVRRDQPEPHLSRT